MKVNVTTVAAFDHDEQRLHRQLPGLGLGCSLSTPIDLYIFLVPGQQLQRLRLRQPCRHLRPEEVPGPPATRAAQTSDYHTVVQNMVSSVPFFNYGVRQPGIYPSTVHNVKLFYDGYPFLEDIWVG